MTLNHIKIFEGDSFRKLINKNNANILFYKKLHLNKTWLSDLIPNYHGEKRLSFYENIYKFTRLVFKIFFFRVCFDKKKQW